MNFWLCKALFTPVLVNIITLIKNSEPCTKIQYDKVNTNELLPELLEIKWELYIWCLFTIEQC